MLYDGKNPILRIIDATQLHRSFGSFAVGQREYAEFSFVISGTVIIECKAKTYTAKAGDILYLPQKLEYTASYNEAEIIVIHLETLSPDSEPEFYSLHGTRSFHALFSSILIWWEKKSSAAGTVNIISLIYRILCTISSRLRTPPHMQKAISFIHANYRDSNLTIGQVCEHAGISATILRQYFRERYKQSPLEYIITLRLIYARTLIASGIPIETAAQQSGFNDPKYFARVTKKYLNRTPSELKDFE